MSMNDLKREILTNKYWIIVIFVILFIPILVYFSKSSECSECSECEECSECSTENYYNNIDKSTILSILSKKCNLSLRDYVNILNSTNNLQTLYLQELCNNNSCSGYNPQNEMDLFRLIKTISAECIIQCIKTNDIYRLALVNLKINDMITKIPHSFTQNYPIFIRSLSNGVYGVESVNIYLKEYKNGEMGSKQKSVKDIVNLYLEKLPKMTQTDQQISLLINKHSLNQKDSNLYSSLVKDFINKINSSPYLIENKNNNSKDFSIQLFDIISTVTLLDLFLLPSLEC